jgi:hypothetical protein
MNPIKVEAPRPIQTPAPLETMNQFKNACLDLRCSIYEMPDSSVKAMLLFYMDSLISFDVCSYAEEAKNNLEQICSIMERVFVKPGLERQFIYLNDVFLTICKGRMTTKMVYFRREHQ